MPRTRIVRAGFNAGEWSETAISRVDLERYGLACRQARNFILTPQGAAVGRPGTVFMGLAKYQDRAVYLRKFVFSSSQSYVLEFGDLYIRVWKDGQLVLDSGTGLPYEIVTPWAVADIPLLQFTQSADVVYIVHPDYAPRRLTRFDHDSWTIAEISWTDGPYLDENTDGVTHIIPSATTGDITLSAQLMEGYTTLGTAAGVAGTPQAALTIALPFAVFIFTAERGKLHTVTLSVASASAAPDLMTCYLYASDGSKATGSALATSDTQDAATTGEKVFTFDPMPDLTDGAQYVLVVGIATPDDLVTLDVVDEDTDFLSGTAPTETGTVTALTSLDWNVTIEYQPTGDATLFEAGHVGALWRLQQGETKIRQKMDSATDVSSAAIFRGLFYVDLTPDTSAGSDSWDGRVVLEKSSNQVSWNQVGEFYGATKQEFFESEIGVYYRVRCTDRDAGECTVSISQAKTWGFVRLTAVNSASEALATVVATLKSTDPTPVWREGAWSLKRGYPGSVMLHDDRICLGGTAHQPYTEWRSWQSDYENFTPGGNTAEAADEFTYTVLTDRISWMKPATQPLIGTASEEARLVVQKQQPMSSENPPTVEIQSTEGSKAGLVPARVGPAFLLADRSGKKILELAYALESESMIPSDLTLFNDTLLDSGVIEFDVQARPRPFVWCVLGDGTLACLCYYRAEKVMGWTPADTDGLFLSVCVIPVAGDDDEVWFSVNRDGVYAIERLAGEGDSVCLDSSISWTGAAASTFTGFDHLDGRSLGVVGDGVDLGDFTVSGGTLTLTDAVTSLVGGLRYLPTLEPIVPAEGIGTKRKYSKMALRLINTVGGFWGPSDALQYPIGATLGVSPEVPVTRWAKANWPGEWEDDLRIVITQPQAYPITVAQLVAEMQVHD